MIQQPAKTPMKLLVKVTFESKQKSSPLLAILPEGLQKKFLYNLISFVYLLSFLFTFKAAVCHCQGNHTIVYEKKTPVKMLVKVTWTALGVRRLQN
jgi:hypothetical protein